MESSGSGSSGSGSGSSSCKRRLAGAQLHHASPLARRVAEKVRPTLIFYHGFLAHSAMVCKVPGVEHP